jgi:uncharacterized surface protein with fasciclin (FAS1) repeats
MHLNRFIATATAAALIVCPAVALAQPAEPPAAAPAAPTAAPTPALPTIPKITPAANLYDTLKGAGEFTIFLKAADQSGIAVYLKQYPLTVFAPTDAAFNALPPDVLTKLMAPNDTAANQLQQIMAYHLINAKVDAAKIRGAKGPVATAEKQTVTLDGSNPDDMLVNNADIIQADVLATNGGVINVIDKVLVPPDSPYAAQLAPPPAAAASSATPPTAQ